MQRRRVTFHPSTKTHDGTRLRGRVLEAAYIEFVRTRQSTLALGLLANPENDHYLRNLEEDLGEILERLALGVPRTPLLVRGGGRGAMVSRADVPVVQQLLQIIARVRASSGC